MTYAPQESLSLFMYQKPRAAKRLYFDVIPRAVDDYLAPLLASFARVRRSRPSSLENPAWHIHNGASRRCPTARRSASTCCLNLAGVCNTEDPDVLWGFISRYVPGAAPESACRCWPAWSNTPSRYYQDFVKPREASTVQPDRGRARALMADLLKPSWRGCPPTTDGEAIQTEVYEVGKRHDFPENLRAWFKTLYESAAWPGTGPAHGLLLRALRPRGKPRPGPPGARR